MKTQWIVIGLILALLVGCAAIAVLLVLNLAPIGPSVLQNITHVETVSAEVTEEYTLPVNGATGLDLTNQVGNITLSTQEGLEEIQVSAKKTAWDETVDGAQASLEKIEILIGKEANKLTIRVKQPEQVNQSRADSVDFTVLIPVEMDVNASTMSGDVGISGVQGDVVLESDFGALRAVDIGGTVQLDSNSGQVSARRVNAGDGEVSLSSDFGGLELEDVTAGKVTVDGRNGEVLLMDVRSSGPVSMKSDFGSLTFKDGQAAGLSVETSSGTITLSQIDAGDSVAAHSNFGAVNLNAVSALDYDLSSDSGMVVADGVQGTVKVRNEFGDIKLSSESDATLDLNTRSGGITYRGGLGEGMNALYTDFGEVRLSLPEESSFEFDLSTDFGTISSEFDVNISGEPDENHWIGQVDEGGPSLVVSTKNGGVLIEKFTRAQ